MSKGTVEKLNTEWWQSYVVQKTHNIATYIFVTLFCNFYKISQFSLNRVAENNTGSKEFARDTTAVLCTQDIWTVHDVLYILK